MLKRILVLAALAAIAMANPARSQQSPPASEKAKQIEAMVNKAAALVDKEGKAAFSEFRTPNSEWRSGDTYLFAYDMKLNVLLNAAFPEREGKNMHGQTDTDGKPMHDEFGRWFKPRDRAGSTTCSPSPGRPNRPGNGPT